MIYHCKKCGWSGEVKTRPRCLPCAAIATDEWRRNNPAKAKAQRARYYKRFRATLDLLAALENLLLELDGDISIDAERQARAAIAKAKGEP